MKVSEHCVVDGHLLHRPAAPGEDGVRWTWFEDLDDTDRDPELLRTLSRTGLDAATVERLLGREGTGVRRPTLRRHGETFALSLRLLDYDDTTDAVETGEEWLVVSGQEAVSLVRRPTSGPDSLTPAPLPEALVNGGPNVLVIVQGVLLAAVSGYEAVVAELEVDVDEVEASVFSPRRTADAERIYALKRELSECRRAAVPLIAVLQRQIPHDEELVAWPGLQGAPDLIERLHRVAEQVETLDGLLSSILDAYVARVSVQQNEDMRKISAGAALVVVPTFLAGVWGMNFRGMPELHWTWGYPVALGVMGMSVLVMWSLFRRSGWF